MDNSEMIECDIQKLKHRTDMFISGVIKGGAAIAAIMLVLAAGPKIEGQYFPVIDSVHATEVIQDPVAEDTVSLQVDANKRRDCQFVDLVALVGDGVQQKKATITFEDPGTGLHRPIGAQSFGVWSFKPKGDVVRVVAMHDCGMPWLTRTYLFTWERNAQTTN